MKILVSDFDNTLYTADYKKNVIKVNEFVKEGNMFVIATGRNISDLMKELSGINIFYSYLICNDGGMIFDKNLSLMMRTDIEKNSVELFNELSNDKKIGETFIDTGYKFSKKIEENNNAIISRISNVQYTSEKIDYIINNYPNLNAYMSDNWLNIASINANKGNAISYLEKHLSLNHNDIYTIGDGINDVSMNKRYKSYAVSNAVLELKNISTKTVNNIIEAIEDIKNN